MGRMNWTHIFFGGLMAGVLLFNLVILGTLALAPGWVDRVDAMGTEFDPVTGGVTFLVTGVAMVWLYAAIRPRYGPGPKTAAIAGFAIWLITTARDGAWVAWDFIPGFLGERALVALVSLIIFVGVAMLTAWAYTEGDGSEEEPSAEAAEGRSP